MKKFLLLVLLVFYTVFPAQTELIFVYFKDKPNKASFYANPLSELTQKALNRRTALGIPLNDQDAPVEQSYIQNVQNLGFTVTDKSKWLNGVAVNATATQAALLLAQPYVQSLESFAKNSQVVVKNNHYNKFNESGKSALTNFNYGVGAAQIDQINLRNLHISGYTGTGITIAVIDTGFPSVDTGAAFSRLWTNNKIKGGYNFISKNTDVYNTSLYNHGTVVLGAIGGYIDGTFVGSAPDADFYLYATEIFSQEIPEEQLYWIEAAEEADRKGVDVINSSLGYSTFDDPKYNYTYADMNGTTTFISRAAQIASEKGIIVVVAAGNAALQTWHYILSPADNAKVFTIGAVDSAGNPSTFSSFGPNASGVIKPDASARGTSSATVNDGSQVNVSGTSIASPIAAGGIACLLQALPASTSRELIKNRLRKTASIFPNHTNQMGYGVLNFGNVLQNILNTNELSTSDDLIVFPNPTSDEITIKSVQEINKIEIYDNLGRFLHFLNNASKINIKNYPQGTYYLKFFTKKGTNIKKVLKN